MEDDDLVCPVQKLGPEIGSQFFQEPLLKLFLTITQLLGSRDEVGADVGGYCDDCVVEGDRAALLSVRRPSSRSCKSMLKTSGGSSLSRRGEPPSRGDDGRPW